MDIAIKELEVEIDKWANYLNSFVAPITLTMGLGCLSLKDSQLYAFICLFFLVTVLWAGIKEFPPLIMALRKKQRSVEEDIVYVGIMAHYFGLKAIFSRFPAFWFAFIFLNLISMGILVN